LTFLPLRWLYCVLNRVWVGYCYKFRLLPIKMEGWEFLRGTVRYFLSRGPY